MDRGVFNKRDHEGALQEAAEGLAMRQPHASARRTFTPAQGAALVVSAVLTALVFVYAPSWGLAALHAGLLLVFAAAIVMRAAAAIASLFPPRPPPPWPDALPLYGLIVPLYREAASAPGLIAALQRLDYPPDRLDILLTLEADDTATQAAVRAALPRGPSPFRVILIPPAAPRTKPKALNYALLQTDAAFIAIYDAEDRPHPQQLNAALAAFSAGGDQLGCVQAPLLVDNAGASWIASQFAAEYAIHFTQIVPFLCRIGAPPPLGGTSNHFRRTALEGVGGWDAYNVTEDADLGYRLARFGWRIGAIAPPTYEEAPARLPAWTRQRSRWIKGHLQTWLVLMRDPVRTAREMGAGGFWAMQVMLFGAILAAFGHAPSLLMLAAAGIGLAAGGPIAISAEDWALAASGLFATWACALCAAVRLGRPGVGLAALTMPLYWPLSFAAALRALVELILRPHYWAKTDHALTHRDQCSGL
jgi:glycosyltransferase XagB